MNQILKPVRGLSMPSITICSQEVFHDITNETTANMMLERGLVPVFWASILNDLFLQVNFNITILSIHLDLFLEGGNKKLVHSQVLILAS